jgi:hypothetical protein
VEQRMTPAAHRFCLSMGPFLAGMYLFGFIVLAKFAPIPTPDVSAEQLVHIIAENKTPFEIGCLLMLVAGGLLAPFGASLSMFTRKTEARLPVMFVFQVASLAAATALFIIIAIFWGVAAFRVGQIAPEITQAMFDCGWFMFLWSGPAFYVWAVAFGLAILWNPPRYQMFPRWVGFFTLASVLCWSMGLMAIFFQTGPTAYSGMLPTWIALLVFFTWVMTVTVFGFRAIKRQEMECRADGSGVYRPRWDDPIEEPAAAPVVRGTTPADRVADHEMLYKERELVAHAGRDSDV